MSKNIKIKMPTEHYNSSTQPHVSSLWSHGTSEKINKIDIEKIKPFQNQARDIFDEDELNNLAESIKEYGIIQPLTVIKSSNDFYEVISGERRLRSAKIAGLDRVPCIIIDNIGAADEIAFIENIHRVDLSLLELGEAFKKYMISNDCTVSELARKLCINRTKISECLSFADIPQAIKDQLVSENQVTRSNLRKSLKGELLQQSTRRENFIKKLSIEIAVNKDESCSVKVRSKKELVLSDNQKSEIIEQIQNELENIISYGQVW
jgi:ParB family chromosome partitioning protein